MSDIIHRNTQTQYKQTCSCTQIFALYRNRICDLLRSRRVFPPLRQIGRRYARCDEKATLHHRPLIPLCGVDTTCFLLPFFSITRHLHVHSFYFHVILHHPYFPRLTSTRVPIYIHTHHHFCYVTFIPPHKCPYKLT
jgi:hypothetical protein